jgi:hypothetical protein
MFAATADRSRSGSIDLWAWRPLRTLGALCVKIWSTNGTREIPSMNTNGMST